MKSNRASAYRTDSQVQETLRVELKETRRIDLPAAHPIEMDLTRPAPPGLLNHSLAGIEETIPVVIVESWGWLPVLSLVVAIGLLVISSAYSYSRAGAAGSMVLFWLGVLIILLPIAARLASESASRRERIGLVALLGIGLFLAKILHSPVAFTFNDELLHLRSAEDMIQNQRLFLPNYSLKVLAYFPGLESVVSAVVNLTRLSPFAAGNLVILTARLILMLSLFFFFEELSGSARIAGLGALLYSASANFLFWSAQFSYESLALPVAMLVGYVVIRRQQEAGHSRHVALTLIALLGIASVVITHHLTSYALATFLLLSSALYTFFEARRQENGGSLWGLAWFNVVAASSWLVYVATVVIGYLSPIFGEAFQSIFQMLVGEETSRELFRSASGELAPAWERAAGLGSVILLLIGLPFGLFYVWKYHRRDAPVMVMALAGFTYFAILVLRFIPSAWEIANRASDFLFIGVAFVLALGAGAYLIPAGSGRPRLVLFLAFMTIVFLGGVIAGWSPDLRLAKPYRVRAGGAVLEPVGVTAARWSRAFLGTEQRVTAPESDSLLMLAIGDQRSPPRRGLSQYDLFFTPEFGSGEGYFLEAIEPRYIVFDRRLVSWDNMRGIYFQRIPKDAPPEAYFLEPEVFTKLDRVEGVSRLLDAGDLVIYDVIKLVPGAKDN